MHKESDFVDLSRQLNAKTPTSEAPANSEGIDANEAARRFLKAHHEQARFKQRDILARTATITPQPSVESPDKSNVLSSSGVLKSKLRKTFSSAHVSQVNLRAVSRIRIPTLSQRLSGMAIDAIITLQVSALLTAAYVAALEPAFRAQILVPQHWDLADDLLFGGIFKASLIVAFVLYPILSFFILNRTVGQMLTGQKVVRYGQFTCNREDIILRSLNLPLSILLLGFIPIFFGKRSLHDFAAGTAITRE